MLEVPSPRCRRSHRLPYVAQLSTASMMPGLAWQRGGFDSRAKCLHFLEDLRDRSVLSFHVLLDLEGGVENRVGIFVVGLRPSVGGGALPVLSDDDDAQQDQL